MFLPEKVKRIVVKVGTSTLTHNTGHLNLKRIKSLALVLSDLKNRGIEIILVSSGAIGVGIQKLNMKDRPTEMRKKQAAAAVGQCELMHLYDNLFKEFGHVVAQVLLTKDVVDDEYRKALVTDTFMTLLELNTLPIVNENDTVSTEEIITFGENDTLSAIVATIVKADLLVMLTDVDGLYNKAPFDNDDAAFVPVVTDGANKFLPIAGGAGSSRGTGGMVTKLAAADIVNGQGINMILMNGQNPSLIYDIFDGERPGTLFTFDR